MHVEEIMTRDVATCRPDTNLAAVARLMRDRDCAFVPLVDADGKLAGVITDRDICIASAKRPLKPEQIAAADAMRPLPVYTSMAQDTIEETLTVMKLLRVRRLPVIARDGTLKGVISIDDIVLASQRQDGPAASDVLSALAGICSDRRQLAVAAGQPPVVLPEGAPGSERVDGADS